MRLTVALMLGLLCFVAPGKAAFAEDGSWQGELSIFADKRTFTVGEPIIIHYVWKNSAAWTSTRYYTSGDLWDRSRLSIRTASGVLIKPKTIAYESFDIRPVTLRSGEKFIWASLALDDFGYSLPPGNYTMVDHFEGPGGKQDTNSIAFTVRL